MRWTLLAATLGACPLAALHACAASRLGASPSTSTSTDAAILFDGTDTSRWCSVRDGGPCPWSVSDDALVVDVEAGDIRTRDAFEDVYLHLEWFSPSGGRVEDGQRNGNSGVKLAERYEVQIMNTGGPPRPPRFNEAGSIYRIKAPDSNASRGADAWQSYDIWFAAPRWDGARKVCDARMTVVWNGVLVHDDVPVPKATGLSVPEAPGAHPILLQAHPSDAPEAVRFRSIWLVPIDGTHVPPRVEDVLAHQSPGVSSR